MRYELVESNNRIEKCSVLSQSYLLIHADKICRPRVNTKSYVPLIAEMFITGRGFMEETPNDPAYVDFAQITGIEMDGKDFEQLLPMIEAARKKRAVGSIGRSRNGRRWCSNHAARHAEKADRLRERSG